MFGVSGCGVFAFQGVVSGAWVSGSRILVLASMFSVFGA